MVWEISQLPKHEEIYEAGKSEKVFMPQKRSPEEI